VHIKGPIARWTVGAATACLALTACGGSSGSSSGTPSGPGAGGAPSISTQELTKIQDCLKAAGIDVPTFPSGRPSGIPTALPSGAPSFDPNQPPPSGFPGGGSGGLNDPKVQQALNACGISLPAAQPNGG